jgi:hypothetical protein
MIPEAKQPRNSKRIAELIVIAAMVVAALVAGVAALYVYRLVIRHEKQAEQASIVLGRALESLNLECAERSCRNAKELVESLSEEQLNYLVGNRNYGFFLPDKRCKILVRKVGNEWWCCSRWGTRPRKNSDERHIYRVTSEGQRLPRITGICEGREYGYFRGERAYSGSIVREIPTKTRGYLPDCKFTEAEFWITIGSEKHWRNIQEGHKHNP